MAKIIVWLRLKWMTESTIYNFYISNDGCEDIGIYLTEHEIFQLVDKLNMSIAKI